MDVNPLGAACDRMRTEQLIRGATEVCEKLETEKRFKEAEAAAEKRRMDDLMRDVAMACDTLNKAQRAQTAQPDVIQGIFLNVMNLKL